MNSAIERLLGLRVQVVMTREVGIVMTEAVGQVIDSNCSLIKAVRCMCKKYVHWLVVVEDSGALAGSSQALISFQPGALGKRPQQCTSGFLNFHGCWTPAYCTRQNAHYHGAVQEVVKYVLIKNLIR